MAAPKLDFQVLDGVSGPYVLMVHGMLSSRLQWEPNLAAVAAFGRPVVVELWGHGRSPVPADEASYHPDAYVAQFEAIRGHLGVDRWVLCGQSLGAALTLRYAVQHPERVLAQVFTNSISALAGPERFDLPPEHRAVVAALARGDSSALASLPFHPARARRLPQGLRERLVAAADSTDPRAVAATMQDGGPFLSVAHALHRLSCPTLLVNGWREREFQPFRERIETLLPGCEVVDLDAGHAVNLEASEGFNLALSRFLARVLG